MNDSYEKLIRDYAAGSLSGHALLEFERRLKEEPELKSELDLYVALKAADNLRLKKKLSLESSDGQLSPEKPANILIRNMRQWLAVAAVVALGAIVALRWYYQPEKPDVTKMAQAYASPYPPPIATMGETDSLPFAAQQAYMAYRTGDFAAAAQQLTALAAETNPTDEILFYTGESLLQTGEWERAIAYFNRVQPGYYREIADWRSALAYVAGGQNAKAKPLLESVRKSSRREQAEKLLEAM